MEQAMPSRSWAWLRFANIDDNPGFASLTQATRANKGFVPGAVVRRHVATALVLKDGMVK